MATYGDIGISGRCDRVESSFARRPTASSDPAVVHSSQACTSDATHGGPRAEWLGQEARPQDRDETSVMMGLANRGDRPHSLGVLTRARTGQDRPRLLEARPVYMAAAISCVLQVSVHALRLSQGHTEA